ncbi:MAG: porin [Xanthobacteraceae bacterium]
MKMVKSLLLGSAAGLMAVAGAQAADLPVKAAPVEYVKICSLYGAGFYYLPGTDICVKVGGYVRGQYYVGAGTHPSLGPFMQGPGSNQNTRFHGNTNDFVMRARTILTFDSRAQTDWGTVRTYMNVGWTNNTPDFLGDLGAGSTLYVNRAFIQWAGFTFGRAQSFYDALVQASYTYYAHYMSDTGDSGVNVAAYTTQWGNGISSTIAIEGPRRHAIVNTDQTVFPGGTFVGVVGANLDNDYGNVRLPDIVSNIRIDQAWGTWQIMSALHDASAAYYFAPCATAGLANVSQSQPCGYPGDKLGWAIGTGANINLPWINKGDRFGFQVNYAKGATRYVMNTPGPFSPGYHGGAYSLGLGFWADAVLRDNNVPDPRTGLPQAGSLELTDAFGFMAVYEHLWTPRLKTSFYGGDVEISYNGAATTYICQNALLTGVPSAGGIGNINPVPLGQNPFNTPRACDPDFGVWFVGSRTQWNIRPDFYMGVDLVYQKLQTSFAGLATYVANAGPKPSSGPLYNVEDQDALTLTFRVHRDILP